MSCFPSVLTLFPGRIFSFSNPAIGVHTRSHSLQLLGCSKHWSSMILVTRPTGHWIIWHCTHDFNVDCEFFVGLFRNGSKTMKNDHICLPKVPVQRQKRWMVKKVGNRRLRALQTFFVVFSTSDFLILTRNSKSSRNSTQKLYFLF